MMRKLHVFLGVFFVTALLQAQSEDFGKWESLFNATTGRFTAEAIAKLPSLANMFVETDYGPGTTLSHWDEEKHGAELMTGFKNKAEHVLPVTIDVTSLFGNKVIEHLKKKTPLPTILADAMKVEFTRQQQAKALDLDYFVPTPIWEETYDFGRRKKPLI